MKIEGLPDYISKNDLDCNCGCGKYIIIEDLIYTVEGLTNFIRKNFCKEAYPVFHSMTRCEKYDIALKSNSKYKTHVKGEAADLHYANLPICKLHEIASSVHYPGNILAGGLGYYDWGIHIDVAKLRTWGTKLPFKKPKRAILTSLINIFQWRTA